ncbi:GNAT family N-acetyltransferase [Cellulomonas fengjieae]|uniref:GNAT family N-acetyltransferase n=1 Tax=Cellulomonas fengjieae TaxID=2819978 RepID=UPI001AAEBD7F|nr:GNAT family N-acetyltransferase [Cellulomonas fengjieae]MBO3103163.1 GNAT family N-acetyltransferase [Cellulomonas fengjieae]
MPLFTDNADVSVRPAVPGDEEAIARIQIAAWRASHAEVLGEGALDLLDQAAVQAQWAAAVVTPPGAGFRVLVACDGPTVVGVVSVAPVPAPEDRPFDAPGGAILALEVEPAQQRVGHGSRLLAAAVDTLREDGADQVHTWVLDGDDARAQFLSSAGLGPDDVVRELISGRMPDGSTRTVTEHRWSASI